MIIAALLGVALVLTGVQDSPAERFNRAAELQRQGALQQAESEYLVLLAGAPRYAEAHANLGAVLAGLGRYDEAVLSYEKALELSPSLTPVLLNLGIAHYRSGQFEKAFDAFQRFLAVQADNLQAIQLSGLSLLEMGRDAQAETYLTRALERSPEDPAVLYGLGLALLRLNRKGLEKVMERLEKAPGGKSGAHLLRGQTYLGRLEFERAAQDLEAAGRLKSDLPRLQYSLGLAYLKLGRNDEAVAAFEKELARAPKDFSSLYYLAYLNETTGDVTAALARLRAALEIEPDSSEGNALLGKMLLKEGKASEAVVPLERAVTKDPNGSEKRYQLARAYQQLGRREDAARQFAEIQRIKKQELEADREKIRKP
ncbi:MAG: tetratricopeptide repeat protein [Acidobacteriota bacterium]